MKDQIFAREYFGQVYNQAVRGLYQTTEERPVSEDCFGSWIDDEIVNNLKPLYEKTMNDWWSITREDSERWCNSWLELHYKNMEACQFQKVVDDKMAFTLENLDTVVGFGGVITNVIEHASEMVPVVLDLYNQLVSANDCMTDSQIIAETARAAENVETLLHYTFGFDKKWGEVSSAHMTPTDFWTTFSTKTADFTFEPFAGLDFDLSDLSFENIEKNFKHFWTTIWSIK